MNNAMILFLSLAAAWSLQLLLAGMQSKRFYRRLQELKREGKMTAVGVSGTKLRGKAYVVLVMGKEEKVVGAERLFGWTVFSTLRPVPELVGRGIRDIAAVPNLQLHKKIALAAQNAATYIAKALDGQPETADPENHFGVK